MIYVNTAKMYVIVEPCFYNRIYNWVIMYV